MLRAVAITSVLLTGLLTTVASAQDCVIQNGKETTIGTHRAIEGTCPNKELPIQCTYDDDLIRCSGPEGAYEGYDLNTLVFSACGCED